MSNMKEKSLKDQQEIFCAAAICNVILIVKLDNIDGKNPRPDAIWAKEF